MIIPLPSFRFPDQPPLFAILAPTGPDSFPSSHKLVTDPGTLHLSEHRLNRLPALFFLYCTVVRPLVKEFRILILTIRQSIVRRAQKPRTTLLGEHVAGETTRQRLPWGELFGLDSVLRTSSKRLDSPDGAS